MTLQETPDILLQRQALHTAYVTGDVAHCIIHHLNLANHLEAAGGNAEAILAQRLAAGVLAFQSGSELLGPALAALVSSLAEFAPRRPKLAASFDDLCQAVDGEQRAGLAALAGQLTAEGAAEGDEALHAIVGLAVSVGRERPYDGDLTAPL